MSRPDLRRVAFAALLLASASTWSQPPAGRPATVEAQKLRPGMHLLTGTGCNVLAWSGPDGTVLVDSGTAAASARLLAVLAEIAPGSSVRILVNTQWHPDHTGGNEAVARTGALLVAQANTRARMEEPQDLGEYDLRVPAAARAALPVVTFGDGLTLTLNDGRLTLLHVVEAHTDGSVIAWWPEANVVHLGDVYDATGYPFIDTAHGGSLAGIVAAIETVLSRTNARTVVVPGHGPVGGRAELSAYRDMLVAVGKRVRELTEQGASLEEVIAAQPTAAWDERYGAGGLAPERFVRIVYEDLTARR